MNLEEIIRIGTGAAASFGAGLWWGYSTANREELFEAEPAKLKRTAKRAADSAELYCKQHQQS